MIRFAIDPVLYQQACVEARRLAPIFEQKYADLIARMQADAVAEADGLISYDDPVTTVEGAESEPSKRRKRKPSLATIIRQAAKAGLTVTAIRPDGTLITGTNNDGNVERDEWDGVRLQ